MSEMADRKDQYTTADLEASAYTKDIGPTLPAAAPDPTDKLEAVEFSNAVRLTLSEWLFVGIFALLIFFLAPRAWPALEPLLSEPDSRIAHDLGNDYWLYERFADRAAKECDTVLIGDSVIWGEYVLPRETLSHYLNEQTGKERFANLGLDGAHPLALSGLVEHYAGSVKGKNVVLECDLRWMISPEEDLQDDKKINQFHHLNLVPQFFPRIPPYKKDISPRLGVLIEQRTPLAPWTNHIQQAYYDHTDIPSWTLEHPYNNPFQPLMRSAELADHSRPKEARSWEENGIEMQEFPWVDPNTSLQWQAFQRTVRLLQERGNRVFVLVGPFNEHILSPTRKQLRMFGLAGGILVNEDLYNLESKRRYHGLKMTVTNWLDAERIPYLAPGPLPSDLYGDASHPLADGYEMLARELLKQPFFQTTH